MHYRRQQRTGDPLKVRKPGAAKSPARRALEAAHLTDWSPRTQSKYVAAMNLVTDPEELARILSLSSRAGGSINVSKLHRLAEEYFYQGISHVETTEDA